MLTACSTGRLPLKTSEQGLPLLCVDGACVQLFGDYQNASPEHLLPPADFGSFQTLPQKHILGTYTTFIEPHFSCALVQHEAAIDTLAHRMWLESQGAGMVETHFLEAGNGLLTVANYTAQSRKYGANCYFRELAFERNEQRYRLVFWTFDHPQNLKTETIRIFDTYAVN